MDTLVPNDISISQLGIEIACNMLITQKKFNAKIMFHLYSGGIVDCHLPVTNFVLF